MRVNPLFEASVCAESRASRPGPAQCRTASAQDQSADIAAAAVSPWKG